MLTVRLIPLGEVAGMRPEWNRLVEDMPYPSIFCTWEWVTTWWEIYGESYESFILGFYDIPRLVGILPLAAKSALFTGGWRTGKVLEFCGREVASDHVDLITPEEHARGCLEAFTAYLHSERRAWDVLSISHYSDAANISGWLASRNLGAMEGPHKLTVAPFLPLNGTFQEYTKNFLGGRGKTIRYQIRRLNDQGFTYRSDAGEAGPDGIRVLFDLHDKRAQMKEMHSTFTEGPSRAFHLALVGRIQAQGWDFFRFLGDGRAVVAAIYGFVFRDRLFYYQIGHEPELDQFSPGAALLYQVIEEAFTRRLAEVDFLRGGEEYKSRWTAGRRELFEATVYNTSLGGALSRGARQTRRLLKKAVTSSARTDERR